MKKKQQIAGLDDTALSMLGLNKEKIVSAVDACILAMGELTISESKIARKHLDNVMEKMYMRSPDTLMSTIQLPQ
jgi:hypothetical protein